MPNWVRNEVTLSGDAKQIKALKQKVKSKDNAFDFNKIVPMPEELDIEASDLLARDFIQHWKDSPMKECVTEVLDQAIQYFLYERECEGEKMTLKDIQNTTKMIHNYFKYGYLFWNDWRLEKWGTKWNTNGADCWKDGFVFDTAWSTPEPAMRTLSELYPDVEIFIKYADEDLGQNCGTYTCVNGCTSADGLTGEDATKFACELWGYDYDEVMEEANQDS